MGCGCKHTEAKVENMLSQRNIELSKDQYAKLWSMIGDDRIDPEEAVEKITKMKKGGTLKSDDCYPFKQREANEKQKKIILEVFNIGNRKSTVHIIPAIEDVLGDVIDLYPYQQWYRTSDGSKYQTIGASICENNYFYMMDEDGAIELIHNYSMFPTEPPESVSEDNAANDNSEALRLKAKAQKQKILILQLKLKKNKISDNKKKESKQNPNLEPEKKAYFPRLTEDNKTAIEKEFLTGSKSPNYAGEYSFSPEEGLKIEWGKYGYSVSESQQGDDYSLMAPAVRIFNKNNWGKYISFSEKSDKFNEAVIMDMYQLANRSYYYEKAVENDQKLQEYLNANGISNKGVDDRLQEERKRKQRKDSLAKQISQKVGFDVQSDIIDEIESNVRFNSSRKPDFYTISSDAITRGITKKTEFKDKGSLIEFLLSPDFIRASSGIDGNRYSVVSRIAMGIDEFYIETHTNYYEVKSMQYDNYVASLRVSGLPFQQNIKWEDFANVFKDLVEKRIKTFEAYIELKDSNKMAFGGHMPDKRQREIEKLNREYFVHETITESEYKKQLAAIEFKYNQASGTKKMAAGGDVYKEACWSIEEKRPIKVNVRRDQNGFVLSVDPMLMKYDTYQNLKNSSIGHAGFKSYQEYVGEIRKIRRDPTYEPFGIGVSTYSYIDGSSMFTMKWEEEVINFFNRFPDIVYSEKYPVRKMQSGGDVEKHSHRGVQFIEYKGNSIMYEPIYNEYFVEDEMFDSLDKAKKYIDRGSPPSAKVINAYRHGAFENGGEIHICDELKQADTVTEMTEHLHGEHDEALKRISEIQGSPEVVPLIIDLWENELRSHFAEEETVLFPRLLKDRPNTVAEINEILRQHKQFNSLIEQIRIAHKSNSAGMSLLVADFINLLRNHIKKENHFFASVSGINDDVVTVNSETASIYDLDNGKIKVGELKMKV